MFAWAALPENKHPEDCRKLYWNLLSSIHSSKDKRENGVAIMKEIAKTTSCDHVRDLTSIRHDIAKQVGGQSLDNILNLSMPTILDKNAASQVNYSSVKNEVYKGLDLKRKVAYQFVYNWDRMVIGAGVAATTAYLVVQASGGK